MILDGALSVETPDTSGEIVKIKGIDMSSFDIDGIYLNYEHVQPKDQEKEGAEKKEANGRELVGKLIYFKKIFDEDDCENDRQRMYFERYNRVPYLYGVFRLFDGAGHDSARALAAIIRDCVANGERIDLRYSVEGNTVDKDPKSKNILTDTIVRAVALTKRPCNKAATSGLLLDPNAPEGFSKNPTEEKMDADVIADILDNIKAEPHPLFQPLGSPVEIEVSPVIVDATDRRGDLKKALGLLFKTKLVKAIMRETRIVEERMEKALTAGGGGGMVAPSGLTGGAALAKEDLRGLKGRALAAIRDYDRTKFDKGEFREFLKAKLPEVDDSFLDHFVDVASDFNLKRATLRAGLKKSDDEELSDAEMHQKLGRVGMHQDELEYGTKVPNVSFERGDLQDGGVPITPDHIVKTYGTGKPATAYHAFIPVEEMPNEVLAEEEEAKNHVHDPEYCGEDGEFCDSGANYPWEDFRVGSRPFPPAKVLRDATGKLHLQDGNHRTRYWTETGKTHIPAWVVDEMLPPAKPKRVRKPVKKSELPSSFVCKLESMTIDLRKAAADVEEELKKPKQPEKVFFAGHHVTPGKAKLADGDYDLLHESESHYVARPVGKSEPEDLVRLPKAKELTHYIVHSKPHVLVADL